MEYLEGPWVADEVLGQVKQLLSSRKSLYPDTKCKKHEQSRSHDLPLLREHTITSGGELSFSRARGPQNRTLQISKWFNDIDTEPLPNPGLEPQFIKGKLCDRGFSIICEFTPQSLPTLRIKENYNLAGWIGNIIHLLDYDFVIQGSDGNLFWENYDYDDQCDPSKATKKRGKSSKPLSAHFRNPQVPEPVPIIRINKFKYLGKLKGVLYQVPPIEENQELKKLLKTLPRMPFKGKGQKNNYTESKKPDLTSSFSPSNSDLDSDLPAMRSQVATPIQARAQKDMKLRQTLKDEDVSQMPFATQVGQFDSRSPSQRFTNPRPQNSSPVNTHFAEGKNEWIKSVDDRAVNLYHPPEILRNQSKSVIKANIPLKALDVKAGGSIVTGQSGWKDKAPLIGGSFELSRSPNSASSTNKEHVSSEERKPGRKLGRPTKPIKMLPLGSSLNLHSGWGGMNEVTQVDVTIPKAQLAILETDAAWYPRVEHLYTFRKADARHNETIQSQYSDDQTDQDSELSSNFCNQNIMPPDSSFLQSQDTPKNPRTRENNIMDDPTEMTPSKKPKAHQGLRSAGTSPKYADPEIEEFPLTSQATLKASVSMKTPCSGQRTIPRQETFTQMTSSYEDPEYGDFPVVKQVAKKTIVRKVVTTKATHVKTSCTGYADPEIDEFSFNKPTQTIKADSDSDTDGDTQLMKDPHGMTNVAKFGILRSQNLVFKKEQKRKRLERLSLGLPAEESAAEYHISEDDYNGYSSTEERQRKRKDTTLNSPTEHSGVTNVSPSSVSPVSGLSEIPTFNSEDRIRETSHLTVEPDYNEDQTGKQTTMTDRNISSSSSPVMDNIGTGTFQGSARIGSKQDSQPEEIHVAPILPKQQLTVRESPHKPKTKDLFMSKALSDDDEDDDYIAQAIPKAFLTQKVRSTPVVSIQSEQVLKPFQQFQQPQSHDQEQKAHSAVGEGNTQKSIKVSPNVEKPTIDVDKVIIVLDDDDANANIAHKSLLGPVGQVDKVGSIGPEVPETAKNKSIASSPLKTPAKEVAAIQVKDTPYPLTKKSTYTKLMYNHVQKNTDSPSLDFDIDIIPATIIRSPPRSQDFEVVIPIRKEIKRKYEEQPAMVVQADPKKRHIRELDFGNEEVKFKDLNEVAREHKRKYLESIQLSENIEEEKSLIPTLDQRAEAPAQNTNLQIPHSQETAPVFHPTLLEENIHSRGVGVPPPIQSSQMKAKTPPVLSSKGVPRLSSDLFDHNKRIKKKPLPKSESATQKALKAIIAAKRASLPGSLPRHSSAMDISYGIVSSASRYSSASVSRFPMKVAKLSSRTSLHSASSPPLSQSALRSFSINQSQPGSQEFVRSFLNSNDTDSDAGNIIAARPPPPQFKKVQRTLIPKLPNVPALEKLENVTNYAGIQGRDISLLIPGYNQLSATKKEKLNDQRKAYFGPGDLAMQSPQQMTEEEEARQKRLEKIRQQARGKPQKWKSWWDEDNTPVKLYSKKLNAVRSVREELEEKDEGMTRVEVYRLSSGGMVRNVRKSL